MAIDAAIAAAARQPVAQRWQGTVAMPSTGREVRFDITSDLTTIELIEVVWYISTPLPHELAKAAQHPRPRILVPR